jgi:hypothetical protein
VIDPYQPYATAIATGLPDARLVVDHFHVIRLANAALDEVRRRVQQTSLGHRGHKPDPLYRIRRRLLTGHERLGAAGLARVLAWLDTGDPDGEVGAAYLAKGLLRETYLAGDTFEAAAGSSPSTTTAPPARSPTRAPRPHHRPLGSPDPALAPHPAHQRRHRGHQPCDQEHQTARLRVPQLGELSAPAPAALRGPMANSLGRINTTPPTTHQRLEPHYLHHSSPDGSCGMLPTSTPDLSGKPGNSRGVSVAPV